MKEAKKGNKGKQGDISAEVSAEDTELPARVVSPESFECIDWPEDMHERLRPRKRELKKSKRGDKQW
ncbi:UV-damage endonuclease [Tolypocladium capitatum]|uniref:UV-damage endonuclease n=1 Tax=Tolypocladium capitatum TaxID=45235 RepID=A0A2K3QN64_9HYPO|nr:UV-damage endonuclease [Tolypocladium capitatum]